jgi:hypothetical protein
MLVAAPLPTVDPSVAERERVTGRALGESLVQGCEVFAGKVTKVGPPHPNEEDKTLTLRDIDIRVEQPLHGGKVKKGDTVRVTQIASGRDSKGDAPLALEVWRGVELKQDERVLIVRWTEGNPNRQRFGNLDLEIGMVVTDGQLIDRIAALIPRHERYSESYKDVVRGFWFVRDAIDLSDALFTGYLVGFMATGRGGSDKESWEYSVLVLSALLNDRRVGLTDRIGIATTTLPTAYTNLSAEGKKSVLRGLIRGATDDEKEVVYNSLMALGKLVHGGADVKPLLDAATRTKLQASYKEWAGKRQFDRDWSRPLAEQLESK